MESLFDKPPQSNNRTNTFVIVSIELHQNNYIPGCCFPKQIFFRLADDDADSVCWAAATTTTTTTIRGRRTDHGRCERAPTKCLTCFFFVVLYFVGRVNEHKKKTYWVRKGPSLGRKQKNASEELRLRWEWVKSFLPTLLLENGNYVELGTFCLADRGPRKICCSAFCLLCVTSTCDFPSVWLLLLANVGGGICGISGE